MCFTASIVYVSSENINSTVMFETKSGLLAVTQQKDGYLMDFPLNPPTKQVQNVKKCRTRKP